MKTINNKQSGVASIFVVIFFMLLISIIVLSFVQIVNQDQRQATNADLYSSAYDSAQAGVEDAKRALDQYRRDCVVAGHAMSLAECTTKYTSTDPAAPGALSGENCTIFQDKLGSDLGLIADPTTKEVKIATSSNDKDLDQAYTCLRVQLYTNDYTERLKNEQLTVVPLNAVGSADPNSITIGWHVKSQDEVSARIIPNEPVSTPLPLPTKDTSWGNKPAVLRVQIVAVPKATFSVDDIDDNSRVVYLYPNQHGTTSISLVSNDATRRSSKNSPVAVECNSSVDDYPCSVSITDFIPNHPFDYTKYRYYLLVKPLYNGTTFRAQMFNVSSEPLKFDGVEPKIDSTGRANDVFRRVVSRVKFGRPDNLTGVDIAQGICKNFQLADAKEGADAYNYYSYYCGSGPGANSLVEEE